MKDERRKEGIKKEINGNRKESKKERKEKKC